jgi:hypothetical protein
MALKSRYSTCCYVKNSEADNLLDETERLYLNLEYTKFSNTFLSAFVLIAYIFNKILSTIN